MTIMQLRVGFEMIYRCAQPTPMMLALSIHPERADDLVVPDRLVSDPVVPTSSYLDLFGNRCSRLVAPQGRIVLSSDAVVNDNGAPDLVARSAPQNTVEALPAATLVYLLGSRYCETELLSDIAWQLFGSVPAGWARVQAICDYVHRHIEFGYTHARHTRTASEAHAEGRGVCRDYAHLAITLCRCMDIPARYCTGYLGDVGTEPPYGPMDFAAWFEAYLGDRWYTFDARNNKPRIGRVLIARGRDACDVALSTTFGPNKLEGFRVWTDVAVTA